MTKIHMERWRLSVSMSCDWGAVAPKLAANGAEQV